MIRALNKLRDIIACPICKTRVSLDKGEIICHNCGRHYKIKEGIPIMLDEESEKKIAKQLANRPAERLIRSGLSPKLVKKLQWLQEIMNPPSPILFYKKKQRISSFIAGLGLGTKIVEIGSGKRRLAPHIINLDIELFPNIDIIGDAHKLPFTHNSLDGVILTNVLEIVENPWVVIHEVYRVLKKGGKVYAEIPYMQPYHPGPIDCQRFTQNGIDNLFKQFKKISLGVGEGPSSTLAWILKNYLACFSGNFYGYRILKIISGWLTFPLKYLDYIMVKKTYSHVIACGFYYIGEKI